MTKLFGPYKKMNRSASMQLSINAIVILVMAMAVLGLGLGLIRGVLGDGKKKLVGALESMDLSEQASSEKVIANADTIKFSRGKETTVPISYYSTTTECKEAVVAIYCFHITDAGTVINDDFFTETLVPPIMLNPSDPTTIGGLFTTNSSLKPGSHACRVDVICDSPKALVNQQTGKPEALDSKSIFVEVQS